MADVLIPVDAMSTGLKKEIALQLFYSSIQSVEITEQGMNYVIAITTDTDAIRLLAQKKELSELRSSGTLTTEQSFLNIGIMGMQHIETLNWHKQNIDSTLQMLKSM